MFNKPLIRASLALFAVLTMIPLTGCSSSRPSVAMVAPTYSYLRDLQVAQRQTLSPPTHSTIMSDARRGPLVAAQRRMIRPQCGPIAGNA